MSTSTIEASKAVIQGLKVIYVYRHAEQYCHQIDTNRGEI
jgi:hypothetical protein